MTCLADHPAEVRLMPFEDRHAADYRALNLAWIEQHWTPEAEDYAVLDHPRTAVIDRGGYIVMAERHQQVVGTCSLLRKNDGTWELAKMAVAEAARGGGVGLLLGRAIMDEARRRGAREIYLESNTVLEPAINLYEKLGFTRVPCQPSVYSRCNIQMTCPL